MISFRRSAVLAAAALVLAGGFASFGGAALPGAADPARVAAGSYKADPSHTMVAWRVNHLGFSDYFGLFGSISGTLTIDPAHPEAASVTMAIPVSRLTTVDKALTARLLLKSIGGRLDYFGASPPDASFVSTRVTPAADGKTATVEGKLTLNRITRPISIAAEFTGAGKNPVTLRQTIGFRGKTTIKRSEFGVNADLGLVSDAVDLSISAAFELSGKAN